MAKKIIALVAAIALVVCFAVSASAIGILTTTSYVTGTADIKVNVTVTGINAGDNVTYYATNDSGVVHIDQAKATDQGAAFEFNTLETNLGSAVIVGYTGASDADETATIKGYTVTYPNGTKVVPTAATTVTITYTPTANKVFSTVTSNDISIANAIETGTPGEVEVTFGAALTGNVTLAVVEVDAPIGTPTVTVYAKEAGAVLVAASEDPKYQGGIKIDGIKEGLGEFDPDLEDEELKEAVNADKEGDRKLTVIGQVAGLAADAEYGVIVSEDEITDTRLRAAEFTSKYADVKYAGATKAPDGTFAIQLIDTSVEDAAETEDNKVFIESGKPYYTAVYAYDANIEAYVIVPYASQVTAN